MQKIKSLKSGTWIGLAVGIVFAFILFSGIWALVITQKGPLLSEKIVTIPKGSSVGGIAETLKAEGVLEKGMLTNAWFKVSAKLMFAEDRLQAGGYLFPAEVSMRDAIKMMARGDVASYQVTFPEGFTSKEVVNRLNNIENVVGSVVRLEEGTILPETYTYVHGQPVGELLETMKAAHQKVLDEAWENRDPSLPIKTKKELLTLASIVEKETSVDRERAEIAGVFVNRLEKGMRLQSDPTVIYGASNYNGNIQRKHLQEKQPYNTYVIKGLPPGPICNPGKASILAAANPAYTENLYFVADGTGAHVFAKTHAEHQKNVQNYLKAYRELVKKKGS